MKYKIATLYNYYHGSLGVNESPEIGETIYASVTDAFAEIERMESNPYTLGNNEFGRPDYYVIDQDLADYLLNGRDGMDNYDWSDSQCEHDDCGECSECFAMMAEQDRDLVLVSAIKEDVDPDPEKKSDTDMVVTKIANDGRQWYKISGTDYGTGYEFDGEGEVIAVTSDNEILDADGCPYTEGDIHTIAIRNAIEEFEKIAAKKSEIEKQAKKRLYALIAEKYGTDAPPEAHIEEFYWKNDALFASIIPGNDALGIATYDGLQSWFADPHAHDDWLILRDQARQFIVSQLPPSVFNPGGTAPIEDGNFPREIIRAAIESLGSLGFIPVEDDCGNLWIKKREDKK